MAKGNLTIGWCDPGTVDSLFVSGLMSVILSLPERNIKLEGLTHIIGSYIYQQRQDLLDGWIESGGDWLLWVDSDIVLSPEAFDKVWEAADEETRPIVSGICMVSMNPNTPLMMPNPCIYRSSKLPHTFDPVHPLPPEQVIQIDAAGFGFLLMHKSIIPKLKEKYTNGILFDVFFDESRNHIGEDISFSLKCKEVGIPMYAHTGAFAPHIKRFVMDINYYNAWWSTIAPLLQVNPDKKDN